MVKPITKEEIRQIINNLPNNKSSESDRLIYKFYKDTKKTILLIMTKLFNKVLETEQIPTS